MYNKTTTIKVLGVEVARIEVDHGFIGSNGKENVRPIPRKPEMRIDTDLLVPLMVEAMTSLSGIVPDKIEFGQGQMLEVNGNIDSAAACQILKDQNHRLSQDNVVRVVLGFAAQTDLFLQGNKEMLGGFRDHVAAVVEKHWNIKEKVSAS